MLDDLNMLLTGGAGIAGAKKIAEKLPNIASEIKGYVILTIFIKKKTAKNEKSTRY